MKQSAMHHAARPKVFDFARQHRQTPTEAENSLWEALREKQLGGHKFRRQHPIGSYILDFYCHLRRLAVELDGNYHTDKMQAKYDAERTAELKRVGIRELRFRNEDVMEDYWGVLEGIWDALEDWPREMLTFASTPDP